MKFKTVKNVPTVFDNMTVSGSDVITVGGQYTKDGYGG